MANQENKGKCETFILRGNADSVMRQLVDEYNSSNGWSVNRIVNNILANTSCCHVCAFNLTNSVPNVANTSLCKGLCQIFLKLKGDT